MFCKTCGKEINDNAVICPNCGCATATPVTTVQNDAESKKKINVLCLVGFILGCVGWLLTLFGTIPLVGLILSIVGLVQANKRKEGLKGLGIAGIIVSAAALVYAIYSIIFGLALLSVY